MKFRQLIKYRVRNIFLQKSYKLVPDPFLIFKKTLYKLKASGQHYTLVDLDLDIQ